MSETVTAKQEKPARKAALPAVQDLTQRHVYVLCAENPDREAEIVEIQNGRGNRIREKKYPPYRNLLLRSAIMWDGKEETKPEGWGNYAPGKRVIRFYDGCTSLFPEDQPKEKETIDQLINQTRQRVFANGEIEVFGYETMLKLYMDICSYNEESPYRVPTIEAIFKPVNPEKYAAKESARLDAVEKALEMAKTAPESKMIMHCNYLGVAEIDNQTGNKLSMSALRAAYRKAAMDRPEEFVNSYDDKSIFSKYWIEKAIEAGEIRFQNNIAVWKSGNMICDISGLKSYQGKVEKLVEFSSLGDGEEFLQQLKALYS